MSLSNLHPVKKQTALTSVIATSLILGSVALPGAFLCDRPVQGQVSISPLTIEVQAKRGQAYGVITVGNNSQKAFRARVYAEPFTYTQDTGFQTLTASPTDLKSYLQFSPAELVVPAGVERRVRFIARFPPSLPDGEYRAIIFTQNLKEVSSTDGSGNKIGITARIGVAVYVRIGDIKPNFSVESARFNPQQNQIQLLVRNTGKASAGPTIDWTLKQGETTIKIGKVNPSWIVPESSRNLTLLDLNKDQPGLTPGNYQIKGKLQWGGGDRPNILPFDLNLEIPKNPDLKKGVGKGVNREPSEFGSLDSTETAKTPTASQ